MIFSGTVIQGKQRGRGLGFPTANVILDEEVGGGVYVGWVQMGKGSYPSIFRFFPEYLSSVKGNNDTWVSAVYIHPDQKLLEAHILDFESDLYGKYIRVELGEKIRDPIRFDSVDALKEQIARDVEKIREVVYGGGNLS